MQLLHCKFPTSVPYLPLLRPDHLPKMHYCVFSTVSSLGSELQTVRGGCDRPVVLFLGVASPTPLHAADCGRPACSELNEGDTSTVTIEVYATRSMGADNLLGRTAFVPAMQTEDTVDVWSELFLMTSSSVKEQYEITELMIKRQHRVAVRAREHTPELLMARRIELRKKKAASIQALKDAIVAAGWEDALQPVKVNKRRRIPISLKPYVPLLCLIGFVFFIVMIAFLPDEILTLWGY